MRAGTTRADLDTQIIANYRKYIRMGLHRSALDLLEAYSDLLKDIDPQSVLRDAERDIS